MNSLDAARQLRIRQQRFQRARELLAYATHTEITIGWDGEFMTFHPHNETPQRFIEEATILSAEIKAIMQNQKLL